MSYFPKSFSKPYVQNHKLCIYFSRPFACPYLQSYVDYVERITFINTLKSNSFRGLSDLEDGTVSKIFHMISCLIPPTFNLTLLFMVLDLVITKGSGLLRSLIIFTEIPFVIWGKTKGLEELIFIIISCCVSAGIELLI